MNGHQFLNLVSTIKALGPMKPVNDLTWTGKNPVCAIMMKKAKAKMASGAHDDWQIVFEDYKIRPSLFAGECGRRILSRIQRIRNKAMQRLIGKIEKEIRHIAGREDRHVFVIKRGDWMHEEYLDNFGKDFVSRISATFRLEEIHDGPPTQEEMIARQIGLEFPLSDSNKKALREYIEKEQQRCPSISAKENRERYEQEALDYAYKKAVFAPPLQGPKDDDPQPAQEAEQKYGDGKMYFSKVSDPFDFSFAPQPNDPIEDVQPDVVKSPVFSITLAKICSVDDPQPDVVIEGGK